MSDLQAEQQTRTLGRRRLLTGAAGVGAGLVLGSAATLASARPATAGTNSGFRWCNRCRTMWYAAGGDRGHCPVSHWWDHGHSLDGSGIYWFVDELPMQERDTFGLLALKWCRTCKAAYFNFGPGVCPNNSSGHTASDRVYRIESDLLFPLSNFAKQPGWNRCSTCFGLFFGPQWTNSRCPAGDRHLTASVNPGTGWRHEGYFPRIL